MTADATAVIASSIFDRMSLTDLLLIIGLVGIAVKTVIESLGWTPTNKLLREENAALGERNKTLEAEKAALVLSSAEGKTNELKLLARIESLELKVRELESRDQGAVLAALAEHEVRAQARADNSDTKGGQRHDEHVALLERAVVALEGPDFQSHRHKGESCLPESAA